MSKGIDWDACADVLDEAFHNEDDAYPSGCPEHKELQDFVPKVVRLKHARASAQERQQPEDEAQKQAAEKLGIPAAYDVRYRINVAVITDQKRAARAARQIDRNLAGQQPEHSTSGAQVVEEYKAALPVYEDFHQKRQLQKLRKLLQDKAALPIAAYETRIVEAVRANPAVVVAGDTGCGKSTQLPQFLLKSGYSHVACTQPRRISAIALCRRVAFETLHEHRDDIAYKVRFDSTAGRGTKVTFLTEGILLRMLTADPKLPQYQVVIIDEVHERHLNTDILLALMRALLLQRPDLRVILMSATINVQAYSDYFGGAPIIQVPGRLYPITVQYMAETGADAQSQQRSNEAKRELASKGFKRRAIERIDPVPYLRLLQQIEQTVPGDERGDLLVFLAGMEDISTVAEHLREHAQRTRRWLVLPLHSALSVDEQDKVFDIAPEGMRKVILSTNIAETSVTIDGVRFVADSGRAKEMTHDLTSGGGSLQEGWISKACILPGAEVASAEQRKGRAGRTGPGQCFRMYTEAQYQEFPAFPAPEIQRVRLESVVLQIKMLAGNNMDPRRFGFIEPPSSDALESAITALQKVGALTADEALTPLGSVLSCLPVDVHIGKMLILGSVFHVTDPMLTIAAALSVQSPFLRLPSESDAEGIRERRSALESQQGDPFTLLAVFDEWIKVKAARHEPTRKWCKKRGLEEQRLYEMAKLRAQFEGLLREVGLRTQGSGRGSNSGMSGRHWSSSDRHDRRAAKAHVRALQRQQERERGRRVLRADSPGYGSAGDSDAEASDGGGRRRKRQRTKQDEQAVDLKSMDLEASVDVRAMASAALRHLTVADVNLLKAIIAAGLYPQMAVPDPRNAQRRSQDAAFLTQHHRGEAAIHPGSVLSAAAPDLGPKTVLAYVELLDTRRSFLSNLTPLPALPALLLTADRVDADMAASRFLVDGWLLLRMHDGSGPQVAVEINRLRAQTSALLNRRLRKARIPGLSHATGSAASPSSTASSAGLATEEECISAGSPDFAVEVATDWKIVTSDAGSQGTDERTLEDQGATGLAKCFEWTLHYSIEVLSSTRAAAEYIQEEAEASADGEATAEVAASAGAPSKRTGLQVAPWLRLGSLRDFSSKAAEHALMPALRRRWRCPACQQEVLADAAALREHLSQCSAARHKASGAAGGQARTAEEMLQAGYEQARQSHAPATTQTAARLGHLSDGSTALAASALASSSAERAMWGRRSIVSAADVPEQRHFSSGHGDGNDSHKADGEAKQSGVRQEVPQHHDAEVDAEQLSALRRRAQAEASRREHWCNVCGRAFQLTPTEILQHKRTHANG
ncbi:probable ATP-dependent RNA helicase DHX34 [Coccomyxa sp. Obi]|nr:probable ATP-dependent RNA helicase DHX34 [Coccomyxa sp. Obi]